MSFLSVLESAGKTALAVAEAAAGFSPETKQAATDLAAAAAAMKSGVQPTVDALVDDAINFVLGRIGLAGLDPLADDIANALANAVLQRVVPGAAPKPGVAQP